MKRNTVKSTRKVVKGDYIHDFEDLNHFPHHLRPQSVFG